MSGTPLHTEPDHLVVTAASLEAGMDWVAERLGVPMAPRIGGEHARLGTHNALLSLGPGFYLEVIAINPAAAAPSRARWFGMDTLAPDAPPRLAHWVARTNDIRAAVATAAIKPGIVEEMSRGDLRWLITIAADGAPACDGAMPSLIQWQSEPHPATALPDRACRLVRLEVAHARVRQIQASVQAIGMSDERIAFGEPGAARLVAHIMTPQGLRTLD